MGMIQEKCPDSTSETTMDMFQGKAIACDASMTIYHFIISTQAIRQGQTAIAELRDAEGNLTGHLVGLFHKTIQLYECGVKPIWVFDGIPSRAKCEEMQRRFLAKSESQPTHENGPAENMVGRSVRVTPAMI